MTTTEKRLGDIADRLDAIAKAVSKLTKEHAQINRQMSRGKR